MKLSNIAMRETLHNNADWVFEDSDFSQILKSQNRSQDEFSALKKSHVSSQKLGKQQTSVSHSATESELLSLDAGSRMDGILTLDLWDSVFEVLHFSSIQRNPKKKCGGNCCVTHHQESRVQFATI